MAPANAPANAPTYAPTQAQDIAVTFEEVIDIVAMENGHLSGCQLNGRFQAGRQRLAYKRGSAPPRDNTVEAAYVEYGT